MKKKPLELSDWVEGAKQHKIWRAKLQGWRPNLGKSKCPECKEVYDRSRMPCCYTIYDHGGWICTHGKDMCCGRQNRDKIE